MVSSMKHNEKKLKRMKGNEPYEKMIRAKQHNKHIPTRGEETAKKQQLTKTKSTSRQVKPCFFVCSSSGFWTVGCVGKKKKPCCKTHQKENTTMTINQKHVNNN